MGTDRTVAIDSVQFLPSSMGGMQRAWTGVGFLKPIAETWRTSHPAKPSDSKSDMRANTHAKLISYPPHYIQNFFLYIRSVILTHTHALCASSKKKKKIVIVLLECVSQTLPLFVHVHTRRHYLTTI